MKKEIFRDEIEKLRTQRIFIRNPSPDDIGFFLNHYQIPLIQKYTLLNLDSQAEAFKFFQSSQYTEDTDKFRVLIHHLLVNQPIGVIYLGNWSHYHRFAEIGYDLNPHFWHQGLMSEALHLFIPFVFRHLGLNRIEATVNPRNSASIKLLENLGFTKEGCFREKYYDKNGFHDEFAYALLKSDIDF